jgi:hypothetical protein
MGNTIAYLQKLTAKTDWYLMKKCLSIALALFKN